MRLTLLFMTEPIRIDRAEGRGLRKAIVGLASEGRLKVLVADRVATLLVLEDPYWLGRDDFVVDAVELDYSTNEPAFFLDWDTVQRYADDERTPDHHGAVLEAAFAVCGRESFVSGEVLGRMTALDRDRLAQLLEADR